jgi:hypothetical protein
MLISILTYFFLIWFWFFKNKKTVTPKLYVYVPRWKFAPNISGIIRIINVYGLNSYIGYGPDEKEFGRITGKTLKKIDRHIQKQISPIKINWISSDLIPMMDKTLYIILESPEFMIDSGNFKRISLHSVNTSGYDKIVLCVGHELDGFDKNIVKTLYGLADTVIAYIPQNSTTVSNRKIKNVSYNATTAFAISLGIVSEKISK